MKIPMSLQVVIRSCIWLSVFPLVYPRYDVWNHIPCKQYFQPENCDLQNFDLVTVDDYDRCGPANLNVNARDYFLGAAGRRITYKRNKDAFDKIEIRPGMLRDVSRSSIKTTVLGLKVDFPIGASSIGMQKVVHPEGELATASGLSSMATIMVLSSYTTTSPEEVAEITRGKPIHLWMQTYIFQNRSRTVDIIRRAERNGYKAIVFTADAPIVATTTCNSRKSVLLPPGVKTQLVESKKHADDSSATFNDIGWLKSVTTLPIIVKGLLSADDAYRAIEAGASAIMVSNHGGRQMDGAPATIDALPGVVAVAKKFNPPIEVYMDGGVRSGHDIYKALARGARMVFVGRPFIWGLALGGSEGVYTVMNILAREFKETMMLAGASNVAKIKKESLIPADPLRC